MPAFTAGATSAPPTSALPAEDFSDGASDAGLVVACRPGESVGYAGHGTVRIDVEATEHGSYFFC